MKSEVPVAALLCEAFLQRCPSRAARRAAATALFALLFASCLGSRQFQMIPAEGPPPTAEYLEMESGAAAATLHFPAGIYTLYATDSTGYYYRAPRKIIQHTGGGPVSHQGGIYVRKGNPGNLRGYVYIAGALTHVGNFSNVKHEFR